MTTRNHRERFIRGGAAAAVMVLTMALLVYGLAPDAGAASVSSVTAPTLSSSAAGAKAVEYTSIGFTVSATGGMAATGSSVTVAAPAGTVLSNGCDNVVHDDTTGQNVGCGGLLTNSNATLTINFNNNQPVNANDHLTVTLKKVTNPAAGTYTLSVSTSADTTPAASMPYTVTAGSQSVSPVTAPVLNTTAAGATAVEYNTIGFNVSPTGALSPDGGTVTIAAPAGTTLTNGCDNVVHDDTTGQGVGCGGLLSNGNATLTVTLNNNQPVHANDHLTISLRKVTNPATGTYTLAIATSSDTAAVNSAPYTITAGSQSVSAVTAPVLNTTAAGATAVEYNTIGFNVSPTGALSPDGGTVTIAAPAGTTLTNGCDNVVHDDTTGQGVGCGGLLSNGNATLTVTLNNNQPVHANDHLTISLRKVTNPATGTYTLAIATSSDTAAVNSAPYTITAGSQSVSAVTAPVLNTTAAGATAVEYNTIGFNVSPTGALSPDGGTVTIAAPAGTTLTNGCDNVVHDDTTGQGVGCGGLLSNGNATLTVTLNNNQPVHANDHLTISLRKVTNPATGTYTLAIATSSDTAAVNSAPYTITAGPRSVSGVTTAASTLTPSATGVQYRVSFQVSSTGALSPDGGTVTIAAPAGTTLTNGCTNNVHDDTTGQNVGCGGLLSNGNATLTVTLNNNQPVHANDHLTVTLQGVTNPPSTAATLSVFTTSDKSPASSAPYITPIPPVPSVSGVNPSSAAAAASVTITGTGFTGATAVGFGPNPAASFSVVSDTRIDATVPAGSATVDVAVTTPGGTSPTVAADRFMYTTAPPTPAVSGISPISGPSGTVVTITGTGFTAATGVSFGATSASSFTIVSDTQITATAPAGTGTVDITVTSPGGTSPAVAADRFTYPAPAPSVTGVSPTSGAAGTVVTITGTGFTGATGVSFGAPAATGFTVVSDTEITATAPAGTGTVDITVTGPSGTSAAVAADKFTYPSPAPSVSGISPTSGAAGTVVTITGTGFAGATGVTFGPAAATSFTVVSDTQITATAPAGTGTVDIVVTSPGGTSPAVPADKFTFATPPPTTTTTTTVPPTTTTTTTTTVPPTTTTTTTVPPATTTTTTGVPATTTTTRPGTTTTLPGATTTTVPGATTTTAAPTTTTLPATTTTAAPTTTTLPATTTTAAPTTTTLPATTTTVAAPATSMATTTGTLATTTITVATTTTSPSAPTTTRHGPSPVVPAPTSATSTATTAAQTATTSTSVPGVIALPPPLSNSGVEPAKGPLPKGGGGHGIGFGGGRGQSARSIVVRSIPSPTDISFSPKLLVENATLALLLIVLVALPAEIFNSTLKQHHRDLARRARPIRLFVDRLESHMSKLSDIGVLGVFSVIGALLYGLIDPSFGFTTASAALVVGLVVAIVVITGVHEIARGFYLERRFKKSGRLKVFPLGLLIAVILVVFSRLAHFQPGYLFGVLAGLSFRVEPTSSEEGRSLVLASVLTLILAVLAWLAWVPVKDAVMSGHTSFPMLVLDAALATTWVCGVQSLLFSLIPMRYMDGETVMAWSRGVWFAVYGLGMFFFVQTIMHPQSTRYGGNPRANLLSMLLLFVFFTVFAMAFWLFFRLRGQPEGPDDPEEAATAAPPRETLAMT